jgi:hypothetical protein
VPKYDPKLNFDDAIVSDSINSFLNRKNTENFTIEEQSESLIESMYESTNPGYDSSLQNIKKSISI